MKSALALFAAAAALLAESHPRAWSYVSPDATSLTGIHWQRAQSSLLADPLKAELLPGGSLDLPEFDWLPSTEQIAVAGPEVLVIATGHYIPELLRTLPKGVTYRGIEMRGTSKQTAALLNEQTLLLGPRKNVQAAIERSFSEPKRLNPLLARASVYAMANDFWTVAKRLPDPVVAAFVPLDAFDGEIEAVEGGLQLRDGLQFRAVIKTADPARAEAVAGHMRNLLPELPQIARAMEVAQAGDTVKLGLSVTEHQLAAGLKDKGQVEVAAAVAAPAPRNDEPKVIRIFGLDDGPREIKLPPKPEPQP